MARLTNIRTGVVVNTSDDNAGRMVGRDWEHAGGATATGYDAKTVEELKDEIRSRNENRDDDARIPLSGAKAELVAALEADD